jgi:hypothetical protein
MGQHASKGHIGETRPSYHHTTKGKKKGKHSPDSLTRKVEKKSDKKKANFRTENQNEINQTLSNHSGIEIDAYKPIMNIIPSTTRPNTTLPPPILPSSLSTSDSNNDDSYDGNFFEKNDTNSVNKNLNTIQFSSTRSFANRHTNNNHFGSVGGKKTNNNKIHKKNIPNSTFSETHSTHSSTHSTNPLTAEDCTGSYQPQTHAAINLNVVWHGSPQLLYYFMIIINKNMEKSIIYDRNEMTKIIMVEQPELLTNCHFSKPPNNRTRPHSAAFPIPKPLPLNHGIIHFNLYYWISNVNRFILSYNESLLLNKDLYGKLASELSQLISQNMNHGTNQTLFERNNFPLTHFSPHSPPPNFDPSSPSFQHTQSFIQHNRPRYLEFDPQHTLSPTPPTRLSPLPNHSTLFQTLPHTTHPAAVSFWQYFSSIPSSSYLLTKYPELFKLLLPANTYQRLLQESMNNIHGTQPGGNYSFVDSFYNNRRFQTKNGFDFVTPNQIDSFSLPNQSSNEKLHSNIDVHNIVPTHLPLRLAYLNINHENSSSSTATSANDSPRMDNNQQNYHNFSNNNQFYSTYGENQINLPTFHNFSSRNSQNSQNSQKSLKSSPGTFNQIPTLEKSVCLQINTLQSIPSQAIPQSPSQHSENSQNNDNGAQNHPKTEIENKNLLQQLNIASMNNLLTNIASKPLYNDDMLSPISPIFDENDTAIQIPLGKSFSTQDPNQNLPTNVSLAHPNDQYDKIDKIDKNKNNENNHKDEKLQFQNEFVPQHSSNHSIISPSTSSFVSYTREPSFARSHSVLSRMPSLKITLKSEQIVATFSPTSPIHRIQKGNDFRNSQNVFQNNHNHSNNNNPPQTDKLSLSIDPDQLSIINSHPLITSDTVNGSASMDSIGGSAPTFANHLTQNNTNNTGSDLPNFHSENDLIFTSHPSHETHFHHANTHQHSQNSSFYNNSHPDNKSLPDDSPTLTLSLQISPQEPSQKENNLYGKRISNHLRSQNFHSRPNSPFLTQLDNSPSNPVLHCKTLSSIVNEAPTMRESFVSTQKNSITQPTVGNKGIVVDTFSNNQEELLQNNFRQYLPSHNPRPLNIRQFNSSRASNYGTYAPLRLAGAPESPITSPRTLDPSIIASNQIKFNFTQHNHQIDEKNDQEGDFSIGLQQSDNSPTEITLFHPISTIEQGLEQLISDLTPLLLPLPPNSNLMNILTETSKRRTAEKAKKNQIQVEMANFKLQKGREKKLNKIKKRQWEEQRDKFYYQANSIVHPPPTFKDFDSHGLSDCIDSINDGNMLETHPKKHELKNYDKKLHKSHHTKNTSQTNQTIFPKNASNVGFSTSSINRVPMLGLYKSIPPTFPFGTDHLDESNSIIELKTTLTPSGNNISLASSGQDETNKKIEKKTENKTTVNVENELVYIASHATPNDGNSSCDEINNFNQMDDFVNQQPSQNDPNQIQIQPINSKNDQFIAKDGSHSNTKKNKQEKKPSLVSRLFSRKSKRIKKCDDIITDSGTASYIDGDSVGKSLGSFDNQSQMSNGENNPNIDEQNRQYFPPGFPIYETVPDTAFGQALQLKRSSTSHSNQYDTVSPIYTKFLAPDQNNNNVHLVKPKSRLDVLVLGSIISNDPRSESNTNHFQQNNLGKATIFHQKSITALNSPVHSPSPFSPALRRQLSQSGRNSPYLGPTPGPSVINPDINTIDIRNGNDPDSNIFFESRSSHGEISLLKGKNFDNARKGDTNRENAVIFGATSVQLPKRHIFPPVRNSRPNVQDIEVKSGIVNTNRTEIQFPISEFKHLTNNQISNRSNQITSRNADNINYTNPSHDIKPSPYPFEILSPLQQLDFDTKFTFYKNEHNPPNAIKNKNKNFQNTHTTALQLDITAQVVPDLYSDNTPPHTAYSEHKIVTLQELHQAHGANNLTCELRKSFQEGLKQFQNNLPYNNNSPKTSALNPHAMNNIDNKLIIPITLNRQPSISISVSSNNYPSISHSQSPAQFSDSHTPILPQHEPKSPYFSSILVTHKPLSKVISLLTSFNPHYHHPEQPGEENISDDDYSYDYNGYENPIGNESIDDGQSVQSIATLKSLFSFSSFKTKKHPPNTTPSPDPLLNNFSHSNSIPEPPLTQPQSKQSLDPWGDSTLEYEDDPQPTQLTLHSKSSHQHTNTAPHNPLHNFPHSRPNNFLFHHETILAAMPEENSVSSNYDDLFNSIFDSEGDSDQNPNQNPNQHPPSIPSLSRSSSESIISRISSGNGLSKFNQDSVSKDDSDDFYNDIIGSLSGQSSPPTVCVNFTPPPPLHTFTSIVPKIDFELVLDGIPVIPSDHPAQMKYNGSLPRNIITSGKSSSTTLQAPKHHQSQEQYTPFRGSRRVVLTDLGNNSERFDPDLVMVRDEIKKLKEFEEQQNGGKISTTLKSPANDLDMFAPTQGDSMHDDVLTPLDHYMPVYPSQRTLDRPKSTAFSTQPSLFEDDVGPIVQKSRLISLEYRDKMIKLQYLLERLQQIFLVTPQHPTFPTLIGGMNPAYQHSLGMNFYFIFRGLKDWESCGNDLDEHQHGSLPSIINDGNESNSDTHLSDEESYEDSNDEADDAHFQSSSITRPISPETSQNVNIPHHIFSQTQLFCTGFDLNDYESIQTYHNFLLDCEQSLHSIHSSHLHDYDQKSENDPLNDHNGTPLCDNDDESKDHHDSISDIHSYRPDAHSVHDVDQISTEGGQRAVWYTDQTYQKLEYKRKFLIVWAVNAMEDSFEEFVGKGATNLTQHHEHIQGPHNLDYDEDLNVESQFATNQKNNNKSSGDINVVNGLTPPIENSSSDDTIPVIDPCSIEMLQKCEKILAKLKKLHKIQIIFKFLPNVNPEEQINDIFHTFHSTLLNMILTPQTQ